MAHPYRFDASSWEAVIAVACLTLLASPMACQSDDAEGDSEEALSVAANSPARGSSSPGSGNATAGNESRTPSNTASTAPGAAPRPPTPSPTPEAPPSTPDPAPPAPGAAGGAASSPLAFQACTHREGTYGRNCDSLYVTMKQMSPPQCVQLTFDNCGEYGREGLGVEVPRPWRLDSGTVGSNLSQCELGVFYPSSSVALRATGSTTWNDENALPTEIVLDLSLETSSSGASTSIAVATTAPIIPVACND